MWRRGCCESDGEGGGGGGDADDACEGRDLEGSLTRLQVELVWRAKKV